MNEIITVYIHGGHRGLSYDPMYKFKNIDELVYRVETGTNVPSSDETVVEGYRGDNLISVKESFEDFVGKLRLITGA